MTIKSIAVLMTVHNRKKQTLACLDNLSKQIIPDKYNYDVWLTDDGCSDGTRETVQLNYPDVHILDGDGNLYWNRGMLRAWEAAANYKRYDYYLWLNDDTDLYVFAIRKLLEVSAEHEDKCNIVGSCQFEDHSEVSYGGYKDGKIVTPNGVSVMVDYFNGNIVLIPDYVFRKIGNLDPYFSHGHGDTDYGLRARENGIKNYVVGYYLGECDRHDKQKKCWDPNIKLYDRLKSLYSPTGYPPKESFYYERKHKGLISALFHVVTLYIRTFFPKLWVLMGKSRI